MTSSNIKFNAIMRDFQNKAKLELEQKKIITGFSYDISNDSVMDTKYLYCEKFADKFVYEFDSCERIVTDVNDNILDYLGQDGYLADIYNAELCNEDWLIHLYLFKKIHNNFITVDQNIDSLHFNIDGSNTSFAGLAAINHFVYNTDNNVSSNTWNWLSNATPINKALRSKYKYNYLSMLDTITPTLNNINIIANSVYDREMKINYITNDISYNTTANIETYIIYVCLAITLLDSNGLLLMRFPVPSTWTTQYINVLMLYSLIFQNVYVYNFNISGPRTYILCKGKKKIANVKVYKALIYLCSNGKCTADHNLFDRERFDDEWMSRINVVKDNAINNKQIVDSITDGLKQNVVQFL